MSEKLETENTRDERDRKDRLIEESVHDTYKLRGKLSEPTRCPQCGAVYQKGRWHWAVETRSDVQEQICSACHRINDNYPAGEITLTGGFQSEHKDEIIALARNLESTEKEEHPLNRIIAITESDEGIVITTTDVHLPRRIGKAIQQAYEGELSIHFDKSGYFTRIDWMRES